eukprot:1237358-Alexandrium_andersonii.AAC.1
MKLSWSRSNCKNMPEHMDTNAISWKSNANSWSRCFLKKSCDLTFQGHPRALEGLSGPQGPPEAPQGTLRAP